MAPEENERPRPEPRTTKAAGMLRKTALVVLGMHRSGTSAMSRVLSLSGAALPENLMPAADANDLGHWEPQDVADLNEKILADFDSSWSDTFGPQRSGKRPIQTLKYLDAATKVIRDNWADQSTIVLKEPRLNLLLELWSQALKDEGYRPVYVIMTRHPLEVAESLKKRDGLSRNQSLILWAKYMLAAEIGTRDAPRLFVRYEDLLTEPEEVLDRVESSLDVALPRRSWLASAEIDRFLTTSARHHDAKGKSVGKALPAIQQYYEYIESAASGAPANEDASAALRAWLATLEQAVGPILASLESNLRETRSKLDADYLKLVEATERFAANEAAFSDRESQLNRQLADLKSSLSDVRLDLEQERARLQEMIDAFKTERDQTAKELAEAEARIAALTKAEADARRAMEDRIEAIESEREAERDLFTRDLRDARAKIAALTDLEAEGRLAAENRLRELETEREAERNRFDTELAEARGQITELRALESAVRRELEDQVRIFDAERANFVGELTEARARIAALANLEAETLPALEKRVDELEVERRAERDHFRREREEAHARISALTDLEAEARWALEDRVRAIEAEHKAERQSLMGELNDARRALEDRIREIEAERDSAQDVVRGLRTEISAAHEMAILQKTKALSDESERTAEAVKLAREVESARGQAQALEQELLSLRGRLIETQTEKAQLEAQSAHLAETVTRMVAERVRAKAKKRLFFLPARLRSNQWSHT